MKWGPLLSYKLSDPGKLSPHDSMKFALSPKLAPKFFSLSKIHTMFYTLIKFHKCFIDDNFWMGLLFQLGRNTFFNLDQLPLIQKYNNRTPEQNYNIYIPLNQQLLELFPFQTRNRHATPVEWDPHALKLLVSPQHRPYTVALSLPVSSMMHRYPFTYNFCTNQ